LQHWQEKNGLFKKDQIISEHAADTLQQDMPTSAIELEHEKKIFEVPLPSSNTGISSSNRLLISRPPSDLDSSGVIGLTKLSSSSLYEVPRDKKTLPRIHDVARMLGGSLHPIESSDNGEIGTIPDGNPILDNGDTCGDLVNFVQSMRMDVLDEAINDNCAFIEAIDGGNVIDQHPSSSHLALAQWKR
jgi:hypothetical protein